jgi:hypothetical protein
MKPLRLQLQRHPSITVIGMQFPEFVQPQNNLLFKLYG